MIGIGSGIQVFGDETPRNQTCQDFLLKPVLLKIQSRVLNLNPEWPVSENPSLESWIVQLRAETVRLLPFGSIPWKDRQDLAPNLIAHLQKQFGRTYRVDEMSEKDFYLFYANTLHSVYLFSVRQWMEVQVEDVWKGAALTPAIKNFGLALMSRTMDTAILSTHYVFPERAAEVLDKKTWLQFPWEKALQIFMDFQHSEQFKSGSFRDLQEWVSDQPLAQGLSNQDRSKIETALKDPHMSAPCCLTHPGCTLCPNNRSWLRKKSGTDLAE